MNQEETMLLHKERYKETIKNLTVMSDILARNVFKDKNACEYVLRIILEDKELTAIDNETQMDFRNMHGRGVVLDCVAKDGSGRIFNVEIQQDDEGAHPKRARYHLGMMDSNVLDTGKNFDKLPETYVIFVTLKEAKEMQAGALADRVHEMKETEKGVEHMCKEMEQICDEARMDEKRENARSMAEDGLTVDRIAKILKVNAQMVQEWLAGSVSTAR